MIVDFILRCGLVRLTLASEGLMCRLESRIVLQRGGSVLWCLPSGTLKELAENWIIWHYNLVSVVCDCMDCCNDTTGIVKFAGLFHVPLSFCFRISPILVFLLLQSLWGDDNTNTWLWDHGKELLFKAEEFIESPALGHAHILHVLCEDLWAALKGWPIEDLTSSCIILTSFNHLVWYSNIVLYIRVAFLIWFIN